MAIDILMPALSPTMEQGKLAKWLKKEGDKVKPGDVLAEIETDKATMEVEAIDEGVLARILISDGTDNVAVNTPIAVLAGEGEDVSGATARGPADGAGEPPPAPGPSAPQPAPVPDMQADDMVDRPAPDARQGGDPGGHGTRQHDGPRGAARCDGGGDAPGRERLRHGRGGRGVPGRLQGHARTAAGVRCPAGSRHPDHRAWLRGRGRRRRLRGPSSDRGIHDLQFRDAGHRSTHQLGGQDALHVRRTARRADRVP